ncbi:unnamed protein product [Gadus morhua 'NCC']
MMPHQVMLPPHHSPLPHCSDPRFEVRKTSKEQPNTKIKPSQHRPLVGLVHSSALGTAASVLTPGDGAFPVCWGNAGSFRRASLSFSCVVLLPRAAAAAAAGVAAVLGGTVVAPDGGGTGDLALVWGPATWAVLGDGVLAGGWFSDVAGVMDRGRGFGSL